jgi:hypothetical protein
VNKHIIRPYRTDVSNRASKAIRRRSNAPSNKARILNKFKGYQFTKFQEFKGENPYEKQRYGRHDISQGQIRKGARSSAAVPHAISQASLPSLISRSVSSERQGAALGSNASLLALAFTPGPLLMGLASGIVSLHAAFVIGAILMLSAWSVLYLDCSQRQAHRGMSPTPAVTTRRRETND